MVWFFESCKPGVRPSPRLPFSFSPCFTPLVLSRGGHPGHRDPVEYVPPSPSFPHREHGSASSIHPLVLFRGSPLRMRPFKAISQTDIAGLNLESRLRSFRWHTGKEIGRRPRLTRAAWLRRHGPSIPRALYGTFMPFPPVLPSPPPWASRSPWRCSLLPRPRIPSLGITPRHVAMLDHMPDLPLHRQDEEAYEIQEKNGPVYRHVEKFKKSHGKRDPRRLGALVPKFKFGQTAGKGAVFLRLLRREQRAFRFWIHLW